MSAEPGQVHQKDPEKVWCRARSGPTGFRRRFQRRFRKALVQSRVGFNRVSKTVPEKVWEALVQSLVRFNRVPKKVPEMVPGRFGAEPGQVQQESQVMFNRGREKVPVKVWEAVVQSQVRFNRVSEKLPEKVEKVVEALGGFVWC